MASDIEARAVTIAARLADVWEDEFFNAAVEREPSELLGLALAHALSRQWIEPDESLLPYLEDAEGFLDELGGDPDDEDGV